MLCVVPYTSLGSVGVHFLVQGLYMPFSACVQLCVPHVQQSVMGRPFSCYHLQNSTQ